MAKNVFRLKREYITDVHEKKPVKILMSDGRVLAGSSLYSIDHPKFTEKRNLLEAQGYIKTERGWWNGDVVLKLFWFNGIRFNVGDNFPCAPALSVRLTLHKNKLSSRK